VPAPHRPRSRNRGFSKIRYFKLAKGYSTTHRRNCITSGVARACLRRSVLPAGAAHRVGALVVYKVAAIEERRIPLVDHRPVGWHVRHDALRVQRLGLCAVVVARIGHDVVRRLFERIACHFGHRLQRGVVGGLGGHLVRHDQRMLSIDHRLHVVRRAVPLYLLGVGLALDPLRSPGRLETAQSMRRTGTASTDRPGRRPDGLWPRPAPY